MTTYVVIFENYAYHRVEKVKLAVIITFDENDLP